MDKFNMIFKIILLIILAVIAVSLVKISYGIPELSTEIEGLYNVLRTGIIIFKNAYLYESFYINILMSFSID